VFRLDCDGIRDLEGLLCALGELINGPGGYFGRGLTTLQDCIHGGFGVTLPFTLHLSAVKICREALDGAALEEWAYEGLSTGSCSDEGREFLIRAAHGGRAGTWTLLDEVVETLRTHGVTVETDEVTT
jgi:hypothetical protein